MTLESSSGERQRRIGTPRGSANGEGATGATPPRSITYREDGSLARLAGDDRGSLSKKEFLAQFRSPRDNRAAHRLGWITGRQGHPKLTRLELLGSNGEWEYAYPDSIWGAYGAGYRQGKAIREQREADEAALRRMGLEDLV